MVVLNNKAIQNNLTLKLIYFFLDYSYLAILDHFSTLTTPNRLIFD